MSAPTSVRHADQPLGKRIWLYRTLALVLAMAPFFIVEFALFAFGIGETKVSEDPFVGFSRIAPLFDRSPDGNRYVISESRKKFFAHDEFPVTKAAGTFRVFVLGGSTVQGRPYSIETSFPTQVRIALETIAPDRRWEFINCGGVSYASYRLVPILLECVNYQPDLFIVCTGHNEFLEDRCYTAIKSLPAWVQEPSDWLIRRRTVKLASQLFRVGNAAGATTLTEDADAILDYQDGIEAFHRDQTYSQTVAEHFESNLTRMAEIARDHSVPLLFLLPPSNLSGQPPFKSESTAGLTGEETARIQGLCNEARSHYRTDLNQAIPLWKDLTQLDPEFARHWYELGQCLQISGRFAEAEEALRRARDLDVCPLRITTPLEEKMRAVAEDCHVSLIDLHQHLASRTADGILGNRWLVDHVHPNFEGHDEIALEVIRWMSTQQLVDLPIDWREKSLDQFKVHFDALDRNYFHRGNRALESLRNWTRGDRDGRPVRERFPHRFPLADQVSAGAKS